MGWRFCERIGVLIPPLGVLPGYRKWPLQTPYPPLIGVSARVTMIGHPGASFFPSCLALPRDAYHAYLWFLLSLSAYFCPPSSHLIPIPTLTQFPLSIHLWCLFYFCFWERFTYPPYYLVSLGLRIVAWLSCTLWLMSTYKWVYTMHVFLGLAYLTQEVILKW